MSTRSFIQSAMMILAATLACGLSSCDTPAGQGAAIGSASGAVIGGVTTNRVSAAAAGAAIGAAAGGLVGLAVEQSDAEAYGPMPNHGYPAATLTDRKGFVLSPYAPYHEIDVQAIPRGALVRDPSCNRLFRNP